MSDTPHTDLLDAALAGEGFLLLDGAMERSSRSVASPPASCRSCCASRTPSRWTQIHAAYVAAGADVVTTNTFGANAAKLGDAASVEEVFSAAVACARAARPRYVAADLGPTGQLLAPMGPLAFDDAYELFARQARAAAAAGADLFVIETMSDLAETKAALLAVRENTDLPALVTMTFEEDGAPSWAPRRRSPPLRSPRWARRPWASTARSGPLRWPRSWRAWRVGPLPAHGPGQRRAAPRGGRRDGL